MKYETRQELLDNLKYVVTVMKARKDADGYVAERIRWQTYCATLEEAKEQAKHLQQSCDQDVVTTVSKTEYLYERPEPKEVKFK